MPDNLLIPADDGAAQAETLRRRALAQALLQYGQEPYEQQTAGGYVVPFNPLVGIAKLGASYFGGKAKREDEKERADLLAEILRADTPEKREALMARSPDFSQSAIEMRMKREAAQQEAAAKLADEQRKAAAEAANAERLLTGEQVTALGAQPEAGFDYTGVPGQRITKRTQIGGAERNLPVEEVGIGGGLFQKVQVMPDGTTRALGQPYTKAADASVDLRRDQAEAKAAAVAEAKRRDTEATNAKFDETLNLMDQLVKHPGLSTSVGAKGVTGGLAFGAVVPGTDAANFTALLDQIKGRQFLQAFETLKGGGQITQVEGEKATNAIARLSTAQSEEEFKKAANEFIDAVQGAQNRLRGVGPPKPPVPPGGAKFLGFE